MRRIPILLQVALRTPRIAVTCLMLLPSLVAFAQRTRGVSEFETQVVVQTGFIGVFDAERVDSFGAIEARFPWTWHHIQPWAGLTITESRTWFAGGGLVVDVCRVGRATVTLGSGPFYYQRGPGRDLGLDLEFYSFLEVTTPVKYGVNVGARLGHLSNAGLGRRNPGTETFSIVLTAPFSRLWHVR